MEVVGQQWHQVLEFFEEDASSTDFERIRQVTERILLGPEGPVKLFSPEMTGSLQEDELMRIAGESFVTANARMELVARYSMIGIGEHSK